MKYRNILVVRTDRIGDVVLTVPAIRALKRTYPHARICVWCSDLTRPLLEGLSFVDEAICEDTSRGWLGFMELVNELVRRRFDLAVLFHTKRRTNAACFLAGIPIRLGYRNNKFGFLLTDPVFDDRNLGLKHESQYCLELLRHVCVSDQDLKLEIPFHRDKEAWAAELYNKQGFADYPVVMIHPDASCPTRRWPAESYAKLAKDLISECGAKVIIVGAQSAQPLAQVIQRGIAKQDILDLSGKTNLMELAALARRCAIFISTDSGPVHIAAAVKASIAVLFLRNQPGLNVERWRPLAENVLLFKNKPGEEIYLDERGRMIAGNFYSITPEEVFTGIRNFLDSPSHPVA